MKKTLFIALAAMMVLFAAGCDNGSSEPEPVAVESVTLNVTTLALAPGKAAKLTATVLPENATDKTVAWSSSNNDVATVDENGMVTAVSIGEATITAQAGGKTAACAIKVHVHSYSEGKCTVCGFVKPSMLDGEIDDDGVLTKYTGSETAVVIPDGVTGIGDRAFYNCTSLASVTIPDGVTSIGWHAFYNCTSLASVEIPGSVTGIEGYAFVGCTSLTSVTIPDGVTSIGYDAFGKCTNLASVTIPASVTDIGSDVFSGCVSLESVTYQGTLAQWCALSDGTGLMHYAKTVTVEDTDLKQATTLAIPNGVTGIGNYAFVGCESLTSVAIPDSVTSIGQEAFYGCASLASVTIPDGVTSIGNSAFYGCASLASVTILEGVTSIEYRAFYGCTSLASVEIPDGVTSIDQDAFYECKSLTSVDIPSSVTSIGDYAFTWCTSLTSVTYGGTKDDWGDIEKGSYIFLLTNVTEITGKDGVTFTVDEYGKITE